MQKICVIQTAFIGDVVLSTSLLESLHDKYPNVKLDIIVRKGNEGLFIGHPFLDHVIVWDKNDNKYTNWLRILSAIRAAKYDAVINVQRYAATGFWTVFSNAKLKIGFDKNPVSFLFTHKIKHQQIQEGLHEIQKNHTLLTPLDNGIYLKNPKLYPALSDFEIVKPFQDQKYICIAPASVWFTKQFPIHKWVEFLNELQFEGKVFMIGGAGDKHLVDKILNALNPKFIPINNFVNLAGTLSFLSSAALQKGAIINYVNDSAPMHFCSAVNAPVVAIYCSTIPDFGYGPLSQQSFIVQSQQHLPCKPCGVHGKKTCPLGHFNCAHTITSEQLLAPALQMNQH